MSVAQTSDNKSPWLTVAEAAHRARAGIRTIHRALADESLRGHKPVPGSPWRIHCDDLDAWIRGEKADVKVPSVTRRRSA